MQIVRFEYNKLIYRRDSFVETGKISLSSEVSARSPVNMQILTFKF